MASYLLGIHTPHRKGTKDKPVIRMDAPQTVSIPMSMHIGKPALPIVKVGDPVKVGTKIGEADGYISSNIYSSVSGKVTKLSEQLQVSGQPVTTVVIESDGEMTPEDVVPPVVNDRASLVAALKDSGIVGLGGAGFPTHVKLDVEPERIEYLLINGAECEPYVTSDTVTMMTRGDDISHALREIVRCMNIPQIIIGVEKSNKQGAAAMYALAEENKELPIKIRILPDVYPQGGEKVLAYHTTGRKIAYNQLPIDQGCVILNCTTVAAIGAYLRSGMPLVEKCVTVEGGAVTEPQNVIAPLGATIGSLFDACGGLKEAPAKLIYGGPMMGITVPDTEAVVMKNTNAVLALTAKEAKLPKTTACIRCGACVNTCPFSLAPVDIAEAYGKQDAAALEALSVRSCMECGCCSFVCPANRPLVQLNKLSKQFLTNQDKKKEGSNA